VHGDRVGEDDLRVDERDERELVGGDQRAPLRDAHTRPALLGHREPAVQRLQLLLIFPHHALPSPPARLNMRARTQNKRVRKGRHPLAG
jgi:hypothetical protein